MISKSISEIAKELGVTRQAIYKRLRSDNQLSTSLQQFTVNQNGRTVYSLQGQELIKQAFTSPGVNQNCKPTVNQDCQPVDSGLQAQVDRLTAQLEELEAERARLLAQVEELRADKLYLRGLLDSLTAQLERVTTALQAAQALHGIDKHPLALEAIRSETAAEPEQEEKEKPPTLRERLKGIFGHK